MMYAWDNAMRKGAEELSVVGMRGILQSALGSVVHITTFDLSII